jgi:hypothetical protein
MTKQRDLKSLVRDRQALTGESYMTALRHVRGQQPSSVPVIELIDASDIGAALGIKCRVMVMPALARRVEVTAMLRQLCRVLLASTRDPAFSLMSAIVLRGERPFAPLGTFEEGLRFHRRTNAGIGGVSDSGRMLSFAISGRRTAELVVCLLWLPIRNLEVPPSLIVMPASGSLGDPEHAWDVLPFGALMRTP